MSENQNGKIQFRGLHTLTGTLELVTGLHIGAGRERVEIGGLDGPVIKHPHTHEPYIPGSSLKGKLRCLLEWALNAVQDDGLPFGSNADEEYPDHPILRLFGCASKKWRYGPTRLVVRDAFLDRGWVQRITNAGLTLTEEKTEVVIDRLQGKAAGNIGPRTMERIPAGARFQLEMTIREYAVNGDGGDKDRKAIAWLVTALKLLEHDALGGSGSRGYGRVRFTDLTLDGQSIQQKFEQIRKLTGVTEPPVDLSEELSHGELLGTARAG
jgi:CRISPR-associated protein Csm3